MYVYKEYVRSMYVYVCVYGVCMYVCMYMRSMYGVCMYICICTRSMCIYTCIPSTPAQKTAEELAGMRVCVCVYIYIRSMYVYMYVYKE
jgi:hypothetical protein